MNEQVKRFQALVRERSYDEWGNEAIDLATHPKVAPHLPAVVAELSSKERNALLDLGEVSLSLLVLRAARGAALRRVVKELFKFPDPDGVILAALGENEGAAKVALETWAGRDRERLATLARSVEGSKKCKAVAKKALGYVDAFAQVSNERLVPSFSAYETLRRIGATVENDRARQTHTFVPDPGVAAREEETEPHWMANVRWPTATFTFSVPKAAPSVLRFGPDPSKNRQRAWGRDHVLRLVHLGEDSLGWDYFWDVDSGAILRTSGENTQAMIFFFEWIGKVVEDAGAVGGPVQGRWLATSVTYLSSPDGDPDYSPASQPAAKDEAVVVFEADGRCTFTRFGHASEGVYALEDRRLTLALAQKLELRANAIFSELVWTDHDEEHGCDVDIVFERSKC